MSSPYRPQYGARPARPSGPEKKGLAIASLILGIIGIPTLGIAFVGGIVGLVLGILALTRANREPGVYGGKGMAIGGIITNIAAITIGPFFIGMIAAIAIPSLLRARVSANEAMAIGDIRTVISGEHAYASSNEGFFDSLECLAGPTACIPGYPATSPTFIDNELAGSTTRAGYKRTFHPGPPAPVDSERAAKVSPSSMMSFAYVAEPVTPNQTGIRSFCGDSTGRICAMTDGSTPEVADGMCAASCPSLQ